MDIKFFLLTYFMTAGYDTEKVYREVVKIGVADHDKNVFTSLVDYIIYWENYEGHARQIFPISFIEISESDATQFRQMEGLEEILG